MKRWPIRLMMPAALFIPLFGSHYGGWVVTTVEDLPDHLVAGQPSELVFTIRQHGNQVMRDLEPTVEATMGKVTTRVAATLLKESGKYKAVVTVPEPGDWAIVINTSFGDNRSKLLPITAVGTGATPKPVSLAERGRHLFVAKGCVSCHTHGDLKSQVRDFAPDLTSKRYAADFLEKGLADPKILAAANPGPKSRDAQMPNLGLKSAEISALVAFINNERQAMK